MAHCGEGHAVPAVGALRWDRDRACRNGRDLAAQGGHSGRSLLRTRMAGSAVLELDVQIGTLRSQAEIHSRDEP